MQHGVCFPKQEKVVKAIIYEMETETEVVKNLISQKQQRGKFFTVGGGGVQPASTWGTTYRGGSKKERKKACRCVAMGNRSAGEGKRGR